MYNIKVVVLLSTGMGPEATYPLTETAIESPSARFAEQVSDHVPERSAGATTFINAHNAFQHASGPTIMHIFSIGQPYTARHAMLQPSSIVQNPANATTHIDAHSASQHHASETDAPRAGSSQFTPIVLS
jgi:hypothetical protein